MNPATTWNGQLPQQSQVSEWQGGSGAVKAYNGGGGGVSSNGSESALSAQKQRARETMAAAEQNANRGDVQSGTANGSVQLNGGSQLSRKRSRDGIQLPVSQASSSSNNAGADYPDHHEVLLERAVKRGQIYESYICDAQKASEQLFDEKRAEREFYGGEVRQRRHVNPGSIFGPGFQGYGNRTTEGKSQILYNTMRGPPKGRRSRELYINRKDNAQQAEQREELVPVRLDIELDKLRLRDTFTWNLHEKLVSQDLFTDYLLEDLKVPPEAMHEVGRQIKQEMQEQIQNYYPHLVVEDGPLEPGRPYSDHKDDEMRIVIKLNITIGRIALVDQFEWDINNPLNSPEEFARQMAWENALSGEFTTAIAHSIREQSQLYTRSLWLTNHCFDGRPVEDPDLKDAFLPNPLHSAFRPLQTQKDWIPFMYEMSETDMERTETSMMREHRAQRRQTNRRGGPALPDLKERPRTVRSLIVHSVIPGAVDTFEITGIPKTRRSGRGGRRTGARADGDVDSEDLESDESGAESPAPSIVNTGTTARTRGMRGAASAAQAAMRANYGRSVTPDLQVTPHETRTAGRRSNLRDEDPADDDTLIVKLKIGKAKLKSFWNEYEAKKRASQYPLSGYASQPPANLTTPSRPGPSAATPRSVPPARNTPQPNGHQRSASSAAKQSQITYDAQGRTDMDRWPLEADEPVSYENV